MQSKFAAERLLLCQWQKPLYLDQRDLSSNSPMDSGISFCHSPDVSLIVKLIFSLERELVLCLPWASSPNALIYLRMSTLPLGCQIILQQLKNLKKLNSDITSSQGAYFQQENCAFQGHIPAPFHTENSKFVIAKTQSVSSK